jgi:hypothetical protein
MKTPIYGLGHDAPLAIVDPKPHLPKVGKGHTFYSGVDVRLYLDEECYGLVQAVAWDAQVDGISGSFVSIITDKLFFKPGDSFETVRLQATNEYGMSATLLEIGPIYITNTSQVVCIDDIVMEQKTYLTTTKP